jgi:hypothetical protein
MRTRYEITQKPGIELAATERSKVIRTTVIHTLGSPLRWCVILFSHYIILIKDNGRGLASTTANTSMALPILAQLKV